MICIIVSLLLSFGSAAVQPVLAAPGESAPGIESIASPEPGWPQWRGPRRDGICDETGLLSRWPEGGPRLLWKSTGLGNGYSCPIVAANRIFITGDEGDWLSLFALDREGRIQWKTRNGKSWTGPFPGARACFAYSQGRLFQMNAHGRLACLDPAQGVEFWAVNVLERFRGKNNTWATSECLLVDGSLVIVTPGGPVASMAALDAATGETVWTAAPIPVGHSPAAFQVRLAEPAGEVDSASYSSPILIRQGRQRLIVGTTLRHAIAVDADSGRLLWTYPMPTTYSVIAATPVLVQDAVFFTAPDLTPGGMLLPLAAYPQHPLAPRWTTRLDTCQGGLVYHDGFLYGSWYRNRKGWVCLNARNGEVRYQLPGMEMGPPLWADQRLYWLSQDGEMYLLRPTPSGFDVMGRFRLVPGQGRDAWAHPVICNKRLYLRYHDTLYCYDVAGH